MSAPEFSIESFPAALSKPENAPLLAGVLRGIEKESLRVDAEGQLAQSAHPKALGAALTHSLITTDFSEALLEFITPPSHNLAQLMAQLRSIHQFTASALGDEMLWASSMPCAVNEAQIPVAQYGSGYRGQMKTVYRVGLGHRYGRTMQTVAGVHYNFSLPRAFWAYWQQRCQAGGELQDFIDAQYFGLIRNFRRHYWVLLYLFGASPALCSSFVEGRSHDLTALAGTQHTLYRPYATSLRMGDVGYQSSAQEALFVCYNTRDTYVNTLGEAIFKPFSPYQALGEFTEQGARKQLNTSLLQIENEFYSPIRPKRTAQSGETALTALCQRGVEYIEVRCLDLDPFNPVGVTQEQIRFLDTFLLYCVLKDSPLCDQAEFTRTGQNHSAVVNRGRDPSLNLQLPHGGQIPLRRWGSELLDAMMPVAELLDCNTESNCHSEALRVQKAKFGDADLTPSARVLGELQGNQLEFAAWAQMQSAKFKAQWLNDPLDSVQHKRMESLAKRSLAEQAVEEEATSGTFEEYLKRYYKQYQRCCG